MNKLFPEPEPELDADDDKEYKVEAIKDSVIYTKKTKEHLSGLYYFVFWKGYPEEESIWEPSSTVMHLRKMISTFYKDHPEKLTAISLPLNSALPMAKPSVKPPVKPSIKQKQSRPINSIKQTKDWDIGRWGFSFSLLVRFEDFFTNSVSFKSFTNSVSFGRDAHSASSFNVWVLYLWATHRNWVLYLWVAYCHCALYLWAAHRHRSSGFPP